MPNIDSLYQYGLAELAAGRHSDAISAFDDVLAQAPDRAAAYYNRGVAYYGRKVFDKAVADLTRAIELSPNARAYRSRGLALVCLGRHEQAVSDYTKSLQLAPAHGKTLRNRGLAYFALDEYEKAEHDFNAAIESFPRDGRLRLHRAHCLCELGSYEQAAQEALVALEDNAPAAECHLVRARALSSMGHVEQALTECDLAIRADPNYIQAYRFSQSLHDRQRRQVDRRAPPPVRPADYGALISRADGRSFSLCDTSLTVGRHPRCDLVLSYPNISGRHCQLNVEGSNWVIADLGSTNGTRVNGEKVRRATIKPGSVVALGQSEFEFHYSPTDLCGG